MRIAAKLGLLAAGLVIASVAGASTVMAAPDSSTGSEATNQPTSRATQAAEARDIRQSKLADAKLRVCQNREKAITNIMARIADRGQKQLDLFTNITTRTEKFYTDKGKMLSNYDALVADVNTKKTVAQTAVDAVKAASTEFTCDGDDPKGAAASFKESLKSEIAALKAYRTSVKNLIVGVKSLQGTTERSSEGSQQ